MRYGAAAEADGAGSRETKQLHFTSAQRESHWLLCPSPTACRLQDGTLDPTFVITHRPPLEQAAAAYKMFNDKADGCVKVCPASLCGVHLAWLGLGVGWAGAGLLSTKLKTNTKFV